MLYYTCHQAAVLNRFYYQVVVALVSTARLAADAGVGGLPSALPRGLHGWAIRRFTRGF